MRRVEGEQPYPNGVVRLLEAIKWATETNQNWIEKISDARIIVELGLGQFGDPDLIFICKTGEDSVHCVFVEAKARTYLESAIDNEFGIKKPGFNSSINGQLSLKYRFAKALKNWNGNADIVSEPNAICEQYRVQLKDGIGTPRKLVKRGILEGIIKPLGMHRVSEEDFHYVALT